MLNPNKIFRIGGQDTKVNLVFSKLYTQMNHLYTKVKSKVYENLLLALYTTIRRQTASDLQEKVKKKVLRSLLQSLRRKEPEELLNFNDSQCANSRILSL